MKTGFRLLGAGVALCLAFACSDNGNVVAVDPDSVSSSGASGTPENSGGGGRGGTAPTGGAGSGMAGSSGYANWTCAQLGDAFQDALEQAAECSAVISTDPCTMQVPREPGCACRVYVGTTNPDALDMVSGIDEEYRRRCELPACEPCDQYWVSTECNGVTRLCRDVE